MSKRKAAFGIAIFSILHFAATFVALLLTFALGGHRFEFGGDASIVEVASKTIFRILSFPGYQLYSTANIRNDAFEWLTVIGNSVLWGAILFRILITIFRMYHQSKLKTRGILDSP